MAIVRKAKYANIVFISWVRWCNDAMKFKYKPNTDLIMLLLSYFIIYLSKFHRKSKAFIYKAFISVHHKVTPFVALHLRHNGRDGVSNHRRIDCKLNRLFRHISKKTSQIRITGFCEGNSPMTGEFPAQKASNAENVSIWWRHHAW